MGYPGYIAPEILEKWPEYDEKCDLWSIGVILYELLAGTSPFDAETHNDWMDLTRNGFYHFPPDKFESVSKSAMRLVASLLLVHPNRRLPAQEALNHEWMKEQDQELTKHKLNMERLRGIQKLKMAVGAVQKANRVAQLTGDFENFMELRANKKDKEDEEKFLPEDSKTGRPFETFYDMGDLVCAMQVLFVLFDSEPNDVVVPSLEKGGMPKYMSLHIWQPEDVMPSR